MRMSARGRGGGRGGNAGPGEPGIRDADPAAADAVPAGEGVDASFGEGESGRGGQQPEAVVHRCVDALLADPGHRASLLALGAALGALHRWGDALRAYRRAARLFPDDDAALAGVHLALARLDTARDAGDVETRTDEPRPARRRSAARGRAPVLLMPPDARAGALPRARLNQRAQLLGSVGFLAGGATFLGLGLRQIDMVTAYAAAVLVAVALAAAAGTFFRGHWRLALKSAVIGTTLGSLAIVFAAVVATFIR